MSAPAFTPGPWAIRATPNENIGGASWREVCAGDNGQVIAEVFHDLGDPDPGLTDEDAEANARLIAAAPELYEHLEWLLKSYDLGVVGAERTEKLLAKARGEQ